jgi:hypothetical protein
MTMRQNQAQDGLPNVLRDQGVPNTIGGIGLPVAPRSQGGVAAGVLAAALVGLLGLFGLLTALVVHGT